MDLVRGRSRGSRELASGRDRARLKDDDADQGCKDAIEKEMMTTAVVVVVVTMMMVSRIERESPKGGVVSVAGIGIGLCK